MESMITIKQRIQRVGSTRQITSAMKLVATAKVQRARQRMEDSRPFCSDTLRLVHQIAPQGRHARHPYFTSRKTGAGIAVIVISADQGLCAGYNVNILRHSAAFLEQVEEKAQVIPVGRKAVDFFKNKAYSIPTSFSGISQTPFYDDAIEIGTLARELFDSRQVDAVYLMYTAFQSLLVHVPTTLRLLPVEEPQLEKTSSEKPVCFTEYEPAGEAFLSSVIPQYVNACIYGALAESAVCEQSARMTGMDAAVKSSDELIDNLTLRYNRARQGAITQELSEIVGGYNAL